MQRWIRALLAVSVALYASWAAASFHTYQIDQVFSNADGSVQFIVLREVAGADGQQFLANHEITVTKGALSKTFRFPNDLPGNRTAGTRALIATDSFAALGIVTPDYVVPDRFLYTDGATLNYAGVSQITYTSLPVDGVSALKTGGAVVPNVATNFAGASASVAAAAVTNVEFYNAALDHYFISSLAPDIEALDTGRISGWSRTGESFKVYPSVAAGGAGVNPTCRILIPPPANSHFFSASPQECADTIVKFPFMLKETDAAFFVALPSTSGMDPGACPAVTRPVYRVFNNRADGNHRYTTSRAIRDEMVAKGGTAEGYGPDAVIMCGAL